MPMPARSSNPTRYLLWTLIVAGLVGGIAIARLLTAGDREQENALQPALPQHDAIAVYFNQAVSARYRHPYRGDIRTGDNLEQVIVEAIAAAQVSVDVAVQELTLPEIATALVARQRAGVRVRVILENQYHRAWSTISEGELAALTERDRHKYEEFLRLADADGSGSASPQEQRQRDAVAILAAAQIPVIDDTADGSKGSGLMHHKFVIVDGETIVTGSANFTLSGLHGDLDSPTSLGNANHLLRIASPELGALFTKEFELMWGDGPGQQTDSKFGLQKPYRPPQTVMVGNTRLDLQFSPTSPTRPWSDTVNGLAGQWLLQATRSIDLALFVFSDQQLSTLLQKPHQAGVSVRGLIDAGFAYRPYSEALDLLGVALPNAQCRYDAGNSPWLPSLQTVGVPSLPEGDVLHHKFAVLDDQGVITGSQNWSAAANFQNDEVLLAIASPVVAAHFQREFDRLYEQASTGVPGWLLDKIDQTRSRCP